MKKYIVVKSQIEGLHQWKDCPFVDVQFLKDLHRHIFHIKVQKEVSHNDRDIEIIMFKRKIEKWLKDNYFNSYHNCCNFKNKSCEMIAEEILLEFDCKSVEVLEDNENGAIIETIDK